MYSIKKSCIFDNIKGMPTYTDYKELLYYAKQLEEDKIAEIESVKGHYEKCKKRIEELEKKLEAKNEATKNAIEAQDKKIQECVDIIQELEKEKDILNMIIYEKNQKIKQYEATISDKNRRLKKKERIIKELVNKINGIENVYTDTDSLDLLDTLIIANKTNEELEKENKELNNIIEALKDTLNNIEE